MKKTTSIFVSSIIVAIVIAGIVLWNRKSNTMHLDRVFRGSTNGADGIYNSMSSSTVGLATASELSQISNENLSETYKNTTYHFSFDYPKGLKPSAFRSPDNSGDVILVADLQTGIGMQIFITPFDEPSSVFTIERIKKDAPSLVMINPKSFFVGSGNGVAFFDGNEADANCQVWFVVGKYLYQITAPKRFDNTLQRILNTLKFD